MSIEPEIINVANTRRVDIQRETINWAKHNLRSFPWREKRTPYSILVAEFLLKRTTATAVARIYSDFLDQYPSLYELANADIEKMEAFLKTIGYHKLRAREFKETANIIINRYEGKIPNEIDKLISIRNIGPYTAGAILSLGYGKPAPMLDSNVERIYNRLFFNVIPEKAKQKWFREISFILVPKKDHSIFNLSLIDLGSLICTYHKTYCEKCPLSNNCDYIHARSIN